LNGAINADLNVLRVKAGHATEQPVAENFVNTAERENLYRQLLERAQKNWDDYRNIPHNTTPDTLFITSAHVMNHRNAYDFICEYSDFTAEQMKCLLQFANPVELVADYLDPKSDISELPSVLSSIIEQQEYYKQNYTLAEPTVGDDRVAAMRALLMENVKTEFMQYHDDLIKYTAAELAEKSDYSTAVDTAHKYIFEYKDYTSEDLEFLLGLSIPLISVADQVYEMSEENVSFPMILAFLKNNYADIYTEKPAEEVSTLTEAEIEKIQEIFDARIKENYKDYCDSLRGLSPDEIMGISAEIYNTGEVHYYLTQTSDLTAEQMQYLLKYENPLEIYSIYFARVLNVVELSEVSDRIFDDTNILESYYKLSDNSAVIADKASEIKQDKTPEPTAINNKAAPDKSDKELSGMAKLRKAEKDKTEKTDKSEHKKQKNMRKYKVEIN
jgi:hypothetical protein